MELKLYVWGNVLTEYTAGIAFAFAESEDHARRLICGEKGEYGYFLGGHPSRSNLRGQYDPDAIYEPGDSVKWVDGKRYLVANNETVRGIVPNKNQGANIPNYPWIMEEAGQWHLPPCVYCKPYGYARSGGG